MRGYAPSSIPSDGSYHVGALMDDALRVLEAAGPTGRDVIIGHDWGEGGRRAGRDARKPVRQGRDHVGATGRGVSAFGRRAPLGWRRSCPGKRS